MLDACARFGERDPMLWVQALAAGTIWGWCVPLHGVDDAPQWRVGLGKRFDCGIEFFILLGA